MLSRTLCPKSRPRTWDPRTRSYKNSKAKDQDKDKDLEPRTRTRKGLRIKDKAKNNSEPKPITSKCHCYYDTLPYTGVTSVEF